MRTGLRAAATTAAALLVTTALASGPARAAPERAAALVRVSTGDPFATCTIGAGPGAVNFPGAEVEPDLTVDPRRPNRLVAAFQQDRWNDGGAHGITAAHSADGGRHFTEVPWPVSRCAPGGLNYERASDPWVSIGPGGVVYGSALSFDENTPRNTVAATVSYDGGHTWRHTTPLIDDTTIQFFNDKNSVTADPFLPGTAYQVWDRIDGGPDGSLLLTAPTMMSVTHDFGRTWSTPRAIVNTGPFQLTIGNIIIGDQRRPGRLWDVYETTTFTDATANEVVSASFAAVRSDDFGRTWGQPVTIANDTSIVDVNPNTGETLRTGAGLPSVAVDPRTSELYVVYEGTDFTGGKLNQVQLVHSTDAGRTWSRPVRVNRVPGVEAMTPTVAVNSDGDVAVSYYNLRTLRPGNTTTLPTSTWLTVSPRGGERFGRERRIAPAFGFLQGPRANSPFVGDYQGLVAIGEDFQPLLVTVNDNQPGNRTDVFTGRFRGFDDDADRQAAPVSPQAPQQALQVPARHVPPPRTRH